MTLEGIHGGRCVEVMVDHVGVMWMKPEIWRTTKLRKFVVNDAGDGE